ncbi:MAG: UbiD family decarboxylase [Deltaproteobacteria bacterium]|nr:UbiD family decarboxylase [Deltaproteobacteria bacterium]
MYADLREYIALMEKKERLLRVARPMNKDTELHPLVRWQFLGLPESERKAFLFENVVDSRGKRYDGPVLIGGLASNEEIYALGMGCEAEQMFAKWAKAVAEPLEPRLVPSGPVKEEIHKGENLLKHGGLEEFPVPISTPGFDNAPYLTACHWVTKDPETGIRNVGNYRAQVKSPTKTGVYLISGQQDLAIHWNKSSARGMPLEAAGIIGALPCLSYVAVQKIAYGVDEYAVAGAIVGQPLDLVKCETVDLEVPATAEIVLEGIIRTDILEPEGPFGESHGYMDPRSLSPVFEITCISHRKKPHLVSILSQLTPSESSKIKHRGWEALVLDHLRNHCNLKSVTRIGMHEPLVNLRQFIVVQMKKTHKLEPWQAMHAVLGFRYDLGKVVVVVDEDIDPENLAAINWALCHRAQPHKDVRIVTGRQTVHSPINLVLQHGQREGYDSEDSSLLIDATKKEDFPPVSLPAKEYMENAKRIWEELGLPGLIYKAPWYGYSLGYWPGELDEEAKLAANGEHHQTGTKLSTRTIHLKQGERLEDVRKKWTP